MESFWEFQSNPQTVIDSIEYKKFKNVHRQKVLIFAGAGMSQESDLPVFINDSKNGIENTLMNHNTKQKDLVDMFTTHEPHKGYKKLLDFCADKEYYIFTSNIDGYFLRSGFDPNKIIEIHGNIFNCQCPLNCTKQNTIIPYTQQKKCEHCNELLVPNVCTGGFSNWIYNHSHIEKQMEEDIKKPGEVGNWLIIEIGAGVTIPVIRDYSEILVEDLQFPLIRINPEHYQVPTEILTNKTIRIQYKAILGIKLICDYL